MSSWRKAYMTRVRLASDSLAHWAWAARAPSMARSSTVRLASARWPTISPVAGLSMAMATASSSRTSSPLTQCGIVMVVMVVLSSGKWG